MNKPRLSDAARAILATVFISALGAMTSVEAVTITAVSANYQVKGFQTTPAGVLFDETVVSTNAEDLIKVINNNPNPFHYVESAIANSILNMVNPRIARIDGSVFGAVRSPGVGHFSLATFSYELVFSIDVAADFSLSNDAPASAGYPAARSDNGSANLDISLKRLDDSTIFSYNAPEIGSAGTYAAGTILAGTYRFLMNGSVEVIGLPPSGGSPFSPLVSGQAIAEVILGFSDATVVPEPAATVVPEPAALWLFGTGLLGLIGLARRQKA